MRLALLLLAAVAAAPAIGLADAQTFGSSPFKHEFGDVKFLDAYFGTQEGKIEAGAGDRNVPFTVVLANVGTQDITGIRGQLALPTEFSASDGPGAAIRADAESNSLAGENFELTFFVSVDEHALLRQYSGSVKVDYSRLRESGTRTAFFEFDFKLTGDSIINMRAVDPFLTSLQENKVQIIVSNDGTASVSDVELELQNTQTAISSTATSVTNVENVVILDSHWEVGHLGPGQSKIIEFGVYVPESLKGESLRTPMRVSYFNAHGDVRTLDRVVDFFVKGLIDLDVYDIQARSVGERQLVTGEIINEGNEDAMFAFVTMSPMGDSNLVETRQFLDEIETDAPVPFNIPVKFDGEPRYGDHDIQVMVRYKDNLRDETFKVYNATVTVEAPPQPEEPDYTMMLALPAVIVAAIGAYAWRRRRAASQAL